MLKITFCVCYQNSLKKNNMSHVKNLKKKKVEKGVELVGRGSVINGAYPI